MPKLSKSSKKFDINKTYSIIDHIADVLSQEVANIIFNDYLYFDIIRLMLLTPKTRMYNVVKMYFDGEYAVYKKFVCGAFGSTIFSTPRKYVQDVVLTNYDLLRNYEKILNDTVAREQQVNSIQRDDVIVFFNGKESYAHRIIEPCLMVRGNARGFRTQPLKILCKCDKKKKHVCTDSLVIERDVRPMEIEEEYLRSTVDLYWRK
jgi:hypothetical protein